jgi:hypothetical protein
MPPRKQHGRALFQARESFVTEDGTHVSRGELVREGHDMLAAYARFFKPAEPRFEVPDVEQATAAPGEKRGGRN